MLFTAVSLALMSVKPDTYQVNSPRIQQVHAAPSSSVHSGGPARFAPRYSVVPKAPAHSFGVHSLSLPSVSRRRCR